MKKLLNALGTLVIVLMIPATAAAHVAVKPAQVSTASYQTFTTSVPNEKDIAVTSVRLAIPLGLADITPTVKPGWTIDALKNESTTTEITWSGGAIPAGQRDDFTFSAQAPAKPTTLQWKAYQTYEDGTTVAWDQKPAIGSDDDSGNSGPYSQTKVVDTLTTPEATKDNENDDAATLGVALGMLGVLLGGAALLTKRK